MGNTNKSIRLLRNDVDGIGKSIASLLKNADEIYICVAFLKSSGLDILLPMLVNSVREQRPVSIFVGTDFFLTEPRALWSLFKLTKDRRKFKFFLLEQSRDTFHPKIYLTFHADMATAIVGSSNLTKGGLVDNIEAATYIQTDRNDSYISEILDYLKSIEKDSRTQGVDPLLISQYERQFDIYRKRITKAEKEAKKEIAGLFKLNTSLLKKYLSEYREDKEQQTNWRKRISDYREAANVLNGMNPRHINSRAEFLGDYEKLVGKKGQRGLWHSGSIFRMKNRVASHYRRFLQMLLGLKRNIGSTPRKAFEIAKSHYDNIEGLGGNVVTEILNTYSPEDYPILNKNPLSSLKKLGLTSFPNQQSFRPETYEQYANLMSEIAKLCGFENLSRLDHFMNYVYWKYVKGNTST